MLKGLKLRQRLTWGSAAGICALLCLATSALLLGQPSFSNASLPVRGITDPILAIQAARGVVDVDYVLGEAPSPDREVMRFKQRIGFALLAFYTALLLVLSLQLFRAGGPGRMLAPAAIVCGLAGAAFNLAGSLAVLRILDLPLEATTAPMINAIRSAAFASWSLTSFTLLLLSVYFFRSTGIVARLTGGLIAITALMQLYGLRDGQFLVLSEVPSALALVAIAAKLVL